MNQSPLHKFVLGRIERIGRRQVAPIVTFSNKIVTIPGEYIFVGQTPLQWLANASGFYLPLPPNVFGVVTFPDGTSHNMEGGLHEVPPGIYSLHYVDKHERLDFSSPISEITTDGEKLSLSVIIRFRVVDPIATLRIDRPVETLIGQVEADVAQYIRTHEHMAIADNAEDQINSKLFSFIAQRHKHRFPLSKAFIITGIELKDFSGDNEYVEMRRKANIDIRKNVIERERAEYQQELERLKAQYKSENEKNMAEHTAELAKKAAEHRTEIEKMEINHEKEKKEILHQVHLREIELDNRRKHLQRRENEFVKVIDAISTNFSSGYPVNNEVIKTMTDLVAALKEDVHSELNSTLEPEFTENESLQSAGRSDSPAFMGGNDKVEKLTNTLLNLLNPKR